MSFFITHTTTQQDSPFIDVTFPHLPHPADCVSVFSFFPFCHLLYFLFIASTCSLTCCLMPLNTDCCFFMDELCFTAVMAFSRLNSASSYRFSDNLASLMPTTILSLINSSLKFLKLQSSASVCTAVIKDSTLLPGSWLF